MINKIKCLDHGLVRLVDYMGNDNAIVQAARVSYGEGTKTLNDDQGLIRYLMRHSHTTPFEMVDFKFHIKAPLFVTRQWLRHRTASVNEISARYSVLKDEFYIPETKYIKGQSKTDKQCRHGSFGDDVSQRMQDRIRLTSGIAYDEYKQLLADGIARELARMVLPVNIYTEFYWKMNLHNLLHFIQLRIDKHAQYEIRVFAQAIYDIIKQIMPITCEAFEDYKKEGYNLSRMEKEIVKKAVQGSTYHSWDSYKNLSKREQKEFELMIWDK